MGEVMRFIFCLGILCLVYHYQCSDLLNMVIGVIVDVMMGGSGIDNLVNSEEDSKD